MRFANPEIALLTIQSIVVPMVNFFTRTGIHYQSMQTYADTTTLSGHPLLAQGVKRSRGFVGVPLVLTSKREIFIINERKLTLTERNGFH